MTTTLDPHLRGVNPDGLPSHDKKVQIAFSWIVGLKAYQIVSVTNTSYYKPGEWLYEPDVAKLAARPGWEFSVTSPDYLGMFLGLAGKMISLPIVAA